MVDYRKNVLMRIMGVSKMAEITKADWKLFAEKLSLWQERYMEHLLQEYAAIIAKTDVASSRFWELIEKIDADKKNPGVQLTLRKSEMMVDLLYMIRHDVITLEDLDAFSESVVRDIKRYL